MEANERLSFEDGLTLMESDDLLQLGALADTARRVRGGTDDVFFDLLPPYWRFQLQGAGAFAAQLEVIAQGRPSTAKPTWQMSASSRMPRMVSLSYLPRSGKRRTVERAEAGGTGMGAPGGPPR